MFGTGYQAAGLLAVGVLAACSPVSPYRSTAAELVRPEHFLATGFLKEWKPLDRDLSESLSEGDEILRRFWLDSCVNELTARFVPAPETAVRAVQVAECMYVRGWHLTIRESANAP